MIQKVFLNTTFLPFSDEMMKLRHKLCKATSEKDHVRHQKLSLDFQILMLWIRNPLQNQLFNENSPTWVNIEKGIFFGCRSHV